VGRGQADKTVFCFPWGTSLRGISQTTRAEKAGGAEGGREREIKLETVHSLRPDSIGGFFRITIVKKLRKENRGYC